MRKAGTLLVAEMLLLLCGCSIDVGSRRSGAEDAVLHGSAFPDGRLSNSHSGLHGEVTATESGNLTGSFTQTESSGSLHGTVSQTSTGTGTLSGVLTQTSTSTGWLSGLLTSTETGTFHGILSQTSTGTGTLGILTQTSTGTGTLSGILTQTFTSTDTHSGVLTQTSTDTSTQVSITVGIYVGNLCRDANHVSVPLAIFTQPSLTLTIADGLTNAYYYSGTISPKGGDVSGMVSLAQATFSVPSNTSSSNLNAFLCSGSKSPCNPGDAGFIGRTTATGCGPQFIFMPFDVGGCPSGAIYDPIVLDMTGEGIKFSSPETNGVLFDINNNGHPVHTGWIASPNAAFLVRDLNGNGVIDNGGELFGNLTRLPDGSLAANGFEALRALDDNHDGYFSPEDSAWPSVKLWFDRNLDGKTDPGEIVSLEGAGIHSINLSYIPMYQVDLYGNETKLRSTFSTGRGFGLIFDIYFRYLVP